MTKTVHFILIREFYDQIKNGVKDTEYRDNTPYWRARILGANRAIFHRGYSNVTMEWSIEYIKVPFEGSNQRIEVHLGERLD